MKKRLRKTQLAAALCLSTFGAIFSPSAMAEDTLGRLFFTPERRQELDRQRQFNIQEKQEIPEDPTLTINGVVTRSSGKRTVWVNGITQSDRDDASGIAVMPTRESPGKVIVEIGDGQEAQTNVGDTINRSTGESSSLLGNGRIRLRTAPGPTR